MSSCATASSSVVSSSSQLLPTGILRRTDEICLRPFSQTIQGQISFLYLTSNNSNLSKLASKVDRSFAQYLSRSDSNKTSISLPFAGRLSALAQFDGDFIRPSINLTWNFMIWHQLIYETLAIKQPGVFGFGYAAAQTIQQAVNKDIKRCFAAALKKPINEGQRADYKVSTIYLSILILSRVVCSLSLNSAPASSLKLPPTLPTKRNSRKQTITPSLRRL